MAGSFWSRPTPDAEPFVRPGATVGAGDTVGLVEVMKTFSPIRAPHSGVWVPSRLEDGAGVSAGDAIGWLRED